MTVLETAASWSQTRRSTNWATPRKIIKNLQFRRDSNPLFRSSPTCYRDRVVHQPLCAETIFLTSCCRKWIRTTIVRAKISYPTIGRSDKIKKTSQKILTGLVVFEFFVYSLKLFNTVSQHRIRILIDCLWLGLDVEKVFHNIVCFDLYYKCTTKF